MVWTLLYLMMGIFTQGEPGDREGRHYISGSLNFVGEPGDREGSGGEPGDRKGRHYISTC